MGYDTVFIERKADAELPNAGAFSHCPLYWTESLLLWPAKTPLLD